VPLTTRALNRALLERQLLLRRHDMGVAAAIDHLVGMQAQVPLAPYTGLFSRLNDFDPAELSRMTEHGDVVRGTLMRRTLHLVTADDFLTLRPVLQDMVERGWASSPFPALVGDVDLPAVLARGRELLEAQPLTVAELKRELAPHWPDSDPEALAYAVRYHLPVVQLPPRGLWPTRKGAGRVAVTTVEKWLGRPLAPETDPGPTILRYLAAFGPATIADIAAWSALTKVHEAVESLELRTLEADDGRELLDIADGPLPDPDTPAPPRFLPPYDNVILGHKDRARIAPDRDRLIRAMDKPMLLVDGFLRGTWRLDGDRLVIDAWVPLTPEEQRQVDAEGERVRAFMLAPAA
jgi:winged helix DNA-binding protein